MQAVEAAEARRDRLTAQIAAMLPEWTLGPAVAALQTMRGMALVNAATVIAELGDLSRFANPRQLTILARTSPDTYRRPRAIRPFQQAIAFRRGNRDNTVAAVRRSGVEATLA